MNPRFVERAAVVCVGLWLAGCPASDRVTADAARVESSGALSVPDAGPPPLEIIVERVTDAGLDVIGDDAVIEAPSALQLSFNQPLRDARLRLIDWRDQIVESDDELSDDGLRYRVTPLKPLESGRRYEVQLDAELGPTVRTEAGEPVDEWSLSFRIAGDVVQPPPPPRRRNRRR